MTQVYDYVGVDYGVRKIAWAALNKGNQLVDVNELVIPKADNGCFLCPVNVMLDYLDDELVPHLTPSSYVAVESPITGASLNRLTAAQMAIVAGGVFSRLAHSTTKHHMVAPSSWKKASIGNGSASKEDVLFTMQKLWGDWVVSQDVADSIGMAMWMKTERERNGS